MIVLIIMVLVSFVDIAISSVQAFAYIAFDPFGCIFATCGVIGKVCACRALVHSLLEST